MARLLTRNYVLVFLLWSVCKIDAAKRAFSEIPVWILLLAMATISYYVGYNAGK